MESFRGQRKLVTNLNILSKFYVDTGGPNWLTKTRWMSGDPCTNSWFRVICLNGQVTVLEPYSNNLVGTISSELGLLTSMTRYFRLYGNSLTGTIPSQLGRLTGVIGEFQLFQNSLTGTIPSELGRLSRMSVTFQTYSNSLTGSIPSQLGGLTRMTQAFRWVYIIRIIQQTSLMLYVYIYIYI
jgi:hypothetical protein